MKPLLISKTTFLEFLFCAKNIWLKLHRPDLAHMFKLSDFEKQLMEQGNEVDKYVHNIFPGGVEVVATGDEALAETSRFLLEKAPAIFQATFIVDGFIAKSDVLDFNKKTNKWDLYEVKATNSMKENGGLRDHIDDVTFQASVLKRSGLEIGKYHLIHLDNEYVRWGAVDADKLFKIEDISEKVLTKLPLINEKMDAAKEYLAKTEEPPGNCECLFKGRSQHCATFEYSNPQVPKYSVHDLSRIGSSKNKLQMLIEQEIFDIIDIPSHFEFSEIQSNQIDVYKKDKTIIKHGEIKEALSNLEFPLYFFDYETFAPAIPAFNGFRPYQRIPFQFSLHTLEKPDGELKHFEYLHDDFSDPSESVAKLLDKYIGVRGTIIVWNKSFEAGVNKEIGERLPEYKKLMERLNGMLYDLMDIFRAQHYVHKNFKGSTSIKKVLPVLAPHLDYKKLNIQEGGAASDAWWKMVGPITPASEKKQIATDLKEYCGLD
ncbi:MAG: DUF2779 domain-containing protein, partial [Minisyncoccia bacterium]